MRRWTIGEVCNWADESLGLPDEVVRILEVEAIDGEVLCTLTERDIALIGIVKFGWRRKLLMGIYSTLAMHSPRTDPQKAPQDARALGMHRPRRGQTAPQDAGAPFMHSSRIEQQEALPDARVSAASGTEPPDARVSVAPVPEPQDAGVSVAPTGSGRVTELAHVDAARCSGTCAEQTSRVSHVAAKPYGRIGTSEESTGSMAKPSRAAAHDADECDRTCKAPAQETSSAKAPEEATPKPMTEEELALIYAVVNPFELNTVQPHVKLKANMAAAVVPPSDDSSDEDEDDDDEGLMVSTRSEYWQDVTACKASSRKAKLSLSAVPRRGGSSSEPPGALPTGGMELGASRLSNRAAAGAPSGR